MKYNFIHFDDLCQDMILNILFYFYQEYGLDISYQYDPRYILILILIRVMLLANSDVLSSWAAQDT